MPTEPPAESVQKLVEAFVTKLMEIEREYDHAQRNVRSERREKIAALLNRMAEGTPSNGN